MMLYGRNQHNRVKQLLSSFKKSYQDIKFSFQIHVNLYTRQSIPSIYKQIKVIKIARLYTP